jgi:predicted RNA binding protein YcfA (HicA-like mRNA interferase family)
MPPVLKPEQIIKGLEKNGFMYVSQKGSHRKYRKGGFTVIVPMHYEIAKGTLRSILEQAGLTLEQLTSHTS